MFFLFKRHYFFVRIIFIILKKLQKGRIYISRTYSIIYLPYDAQYNVTAIVYLFIFFLVEYNRCNKKTLPIKLYMRSSSNCYLTHLRYKHLNSRCTHSDVGTESVCANDKDESSYTKPTYYYNS